jgi:hypothetical protein
MPKLNMAGTELTAFSFQSPITLLTLPDFAINYWHRSLIDLFSQGLMTKRNTIYSLNQIISSIVMLLALAWLTVSTPFVYRAQQQQEKLAQQYQCAEESDEDYNPFASTNEEKTENGSTNFSEEYLHHGHHIDQHSTPVVTYYKCHLADEYIAYHPEFFSPPPEGLHA